ncbi:MAG: hypothetical protein LBE49_08550 [Deltaproteobacteria bacterium]|jgi:hypothetical protein|nr:hypothetical protein [Deltaproteobacteria bacterium]
MAKGKRSQKKRGQGRGPQLRLENLPVSERLGHFWESGSWELFLAEWAERSQSPKAISWAPLVPAARYNHLTKTLFEDKNLKRALSIASNLLSFEERLPPLLKACASIVLSLGDLDKGGSGQGSLEAASIDPGLLPAPWLKLCKAIEDRLKPGEGPADPLAKTREKIIRKMERRLLKIAPGASSYVFHAFQKSCEELLETAASNPQKEIFGALRELSSLIKTVSSKRDPNSEKAKDLGDLLSKGRYALLRRHLDHRAVLAVWRRLADVGEARFGRSWSETAKSMVFKHEPGLDPLAKKALDASASSEGDLVDWLDSIKKNFNWSPPERLLFEMASIHRALEQRDLAFQHKRVSMFTTKGEYDSRQFYGADKGRVEQLRRRFLALDKGFKECELATVWDWGVDDCFLEVLQMVPDAMADLSRWAFPFKTASEELLARVAGISRDLPSFVESLKKAERILRLEDGADLMHMASGLIWRLYESALASADLDEIMGGLETVMTPEAFVKTVRALVAAAVVYHSGINLEFRDLLVDEDFLKPERLDKVFARMPKTLARVKGSVQYRLLALSTSLASPLDKASEEDVERLMRDVIEGDEADDMTGVGLVCLNMVKAEPDLAIIGGLLTNSIGILDKFGMAMELYEFIDNNVPEERMDLMKLHFRGSIATQYRLHNLAERFEGLKFEDEDEEEEKARASGRSPGSSSRYAEMRRGWSRQGDGERSFDPSVFSDRDSFHFMAARVVEIVLNPHDKDKR